MEDKQAICDALTKTLMLTRNHSDLDCLTYESDEDHEMEFVTVRRKGGTTKRINVSLDSGTAMIRDIMRAID